MNTCKSPCNCSICNAHRMGAAQTSFAYPFSPESFPAFPTFASDVAPYNGEEAFLGNVVRGVSRTASKAVSQATKTVARAAHTPLRGVVRGATRVAGQVAKGVSQTARAVNRVVPLSQIADAASRVAPATPWGLATRAAWGGISAAAKGQNVLHGATRSLAPDLGGRFLIDAGLGIARGKNFWQAVKQAGQAGISDMRERMRFAEMIAPFVPGIGTGIGAALGAANALAAGRPITEALIAAARGALPGGAIAQTGFDIALNLARGKNLGQAALEAARARLPGGPAAQAAFDTAFALAQGKNIQEAALRAAGRVLPPSPYAADALSFARRVAKGQNLQTAALSLAGQKILNRMPQAQDVTREQFIFESEPFAVSLEYEQDQEISALVQKFQALWGEQLRTARRMFEEKRYGCWCGPSNVCFKVINNIDRCCQAHDEAYARVGVTSGNGSGINMWTVEGLKRTQDADLELVRCTQATLFDPHWYGPAANLYRTGVAIIFGTRAAAAAAAKAMGL